MATTTTTTSNNFVTLTVVVLDAKSKPVSGARVSITPATSSGVTDANGEIQFKLSNAPKYMVTATAGSNTVTVPYYVTRDGATRLVVSPSHVKTVEASLQSPWPINHPILTGGIVILIIAIIVGVYFFRKRR